jgi:hypothetical protein
VNTKMFWLFGILQSVTLGTIIFLLFRSLSTIRGESVIGLDTQVVLSGAFPVFLLIVEYIIYSRRQ